MGYEIAGALGSKLAEPQKEVYAMCGDGSYLMLHSELVTSIQEHKKINVLLFDNSGFGCINNLEMSNGIGNLATEFRFRDENGDLLGDLVPIDFAKSAEGYGVKTYTARTLEQLENALRDSLDSKVSTLIDIKVLPKTMTDGYGAWWNVGVASTSDNKAVNEAYKNKKKTKVKRGNIDMLDKNKVKLGIAPIAWTNDDMPDLGSENTFEQCISEMALAGFTGCEVGNKYPRDDIPALKKALSLRNMQICNAWFSSFLLTKPYDEVEKDFTDHISFLKEMGARVVGISEQSYSIQGTDKSDFQRQIYNER